MRDEAEYKGDSGAGGLGARRRRDAVGVNVDDAYAEVERVTRERARNFAYGIMVLARGRSGGRSRRSTPSRARSTTSPTATLRTARSGRCSRSCTAASTTPPDGEAMWVALADARARFTIPGQALHDLVDGGLIDLDRPRYETFDELRDYCAHVAGAVGVACIGVYGADQPQRAESLGIALQLINIIRDVREDWRLGRVYLPQDELASYGVTEDDIAAERLTSAWQALMAYQAARARNYLAGRLDPARLPRHAQLRLRRDVRRAVPGDAGAHRGERASTSSTDRLGCRR